MRRIFLMRGAPGSGKGHWLFYNEKVWFTEGRRAVCSADDFFLKANGNYDWERNLLGAAHKQSYDRCEHFMQEGIETIYVDNTNITFRDMRPYLHLAKTYDYEVQFITIDDSFELSAEELAARNIHGVPAETIQRMKDNFEPNPIFCSQCKTWRSGKQTNHTCGSTDAKPQSESNKSKL
jgi:predicted kinase